MTAVYDAGLFIAAERGDRIALAEHTLRLQRREIPTTTAPVMAQVLRSGRQTQLHRVLRGCDVAPFAESDGREVGALLAATGTSDVVDGHVALVASRLGAVVITSDVGDMERLTAHVGRGVRVVGI